MATEIQALINAITASNALKEKEIQLLGKLTSAVEQIKMNQLGQKPRHGFDVKRQAFILVSPRRNGNSVMEVDGQPSDHTSVTGKLLSVTIEQAVYREDSVYGEGKYQMMFLNIQAGDDSIKLKVGRSNRPSVYAKSILLALLEMTKDQQQNVTFEFSLPNKPGSQDKQLVLCSVFADGIPFYSAYPTLKSKADETRYWQEVWDKVIFKYQATVVSKIKDDDGEQVTPRIPRIPRIPLPTRTRWE